MTPEKILWAANTYWDSPFKVGASHLATCAVKSGANVAFTTDPVSAFHLLKPGGKSEIYDRIRNWRNGGGYDFDGKLFYYTPFTLWPPQNLPLLKSKFVLDTWHKATTPNVASKIKHEGFSEVDLLVIDTVVQGFWLDCIKAKKTVFRITDKLSGFQKSTPALIEREKEIARRVDLVAYTANPLREHAQSMNPKQILHLPNGVDYHFFEEFRALPAPDEYANIKKPIIVYVGAMDAWFDFPLVEKIADKFDNAQIVLIGPDGEARKKLSPKPNLHILGRVAHSQLPQLLHHADIGIIPFDRDNNRELVDSINPLKLYEYMACGLPVVATRWEELNKIESPATLCENHEQFIDGIGKALNSKTDETRLKEFAKSMDWSNRYESLIKMLFE